VEPFKAGASLWQEILFEDHAQPLEVGKQRPGRHQASIHRLPPRSKRAYVVLAISLANGRTALAFNRSQGAKAQSLKDCGRQDNQNAQCDDSKPDGMVMYELS
jgi:hypothetical protein